MERMISIRYCQLDFSKQCETEEPAGDRNPTQKNDTEKLHNKTATTQKNCYLFHSLGLTWNNLMRFSIWWKNF